jgi:hypothetical protein
MNLKEVFSLTFKYVGVLQIAELEIAVRDIVVAGHNWTDVCARYAFLLLV